MVKKLILILIFFIYLIIGNNFYVYAATGNISQTGFMIETDTFSIGGEGIEDIKEEGDSAQTINNFLGVIIKKLMIALGVISLLTMTVGAGYIIFAHGEDEYLSKGKNIFIAGILALVVSLCSYYIVNLVGYVLYN